MLCLRVNKMASSLYHQSIAYVVKNINNVQTFAGIPELIGEELFNAFTVHCLATGDRSQLACGLKVFSETYGALVLTSLNLSRQLLSINEYSECLMPIMTNLVSLDISNCQLGMSHEILQHFVNMKSLQILNLRNCGVTDDALRKLTIPCRMYNKGFVDLQRLDLSCNPKLTRLSLQFLNCLKKVDVLLLSGTSIMQSEAEIFGRNFGFKLANDQNNEARCKVETQGWAKTIIQHWIGITNSPRKPSSPESRLQAANFYLRCRIRLEMVKELKSSQPPKQIPRICLIRCSISEKDKQDTASIIPEPSKQSEIFISTDADEDLMSSYLVHRPRKNTAKRNLLQALDMSS